MDRYCIIIDGFFSSIWTLFGRTLGWQSSRKRPTSSLHSRATASWSFIPAVVCRNLQYHSSSLSTHFSILSAFPSLTLNPMQYRKLSSYSRWIFLSWPFLSICICWSLSVRIMKDKTDKRKTMTILWLLWLYNHYVLFKNPDIMAVIIQHVYIFFFNGI